MHVIPQDGLWFVHIQFSSMVIRIILLLWEFLPCVNADGFLLKSEWLQVSSSLQESTQYSSRS